MWKWEEGRQGGGYRKFSMVMTKFPIPWDLHLLHMPKGSCIKEHTDPFPGYKMYRVNIVLKEPEVGGQFVCPGAMADWRRIKIFRPDTMPHKVECVEEGERFVLSFGWCIKE